MHIRKKLLPEIGTELTTYTDHIFFTRFQTYLRKSTRPGVKMPSMRTPRVFAFILVAFACLLFLPARCHAQAALLMEEPYGFFGTVNPTGHTAVYFANICAETPTRLRRCEPGEMGSVIACYSGLNDYDWIAIPLIPYLYSVEDISQVPEHVDRATVNRLRDKYHEAHLLDLGDHVSKGGF